MTEQPTGDRRPIASRNRPIWQHSAQALAAAGVSANAISVMGMAAGLGAAAALVGTKYIASPRLLFIAAAALIQMRLLANMLDGMVAIASKKASAVGELFNEIPDRVSDTAILAGAGYAAGGDPALGWAAAVVALFVTYVRAVGKGAGVPGLFQGPMSKSHRMFLMTMTCLYLGLAPRSFQICFAWPWSERCAGLLSIALAIVVIGGLITAWRRLARIVRALKEKR